MVCRELWLYVPHGWISQELTSFPINKTRQQTFMSTILFNLDTSTSSFMWNFQWENRSSYTKSNFTNFLSIVCYIWDICIGLETFSNITHFIFYQLQLPFENKISFQNECLQCEIDFKNINLKWLVGRFWQNCWYSLWLIGPEEMGVILLWYYQD